MMEQESLLSEAVATGRPENKDKIALIDADTLVYAVCSVCEIGDDEAGYQIDLAYAEETAINKIKMILEETGCSEAELHFTAGKNFRYSVDPNYKSNRSDQRTPVGLSDLKEILTSMFSGSMIHTEIESDDYVVWAKKYGPSHVRQVKESQELSNLASKRLLADSSKPQKLRQDNLEIYDQWDRMLTRCYSDFDNPAYKQYKINGIKVYEPWVSSPSAYIEWAKVNGWFEGCSIDRVNHRGHYIPSNVQFVTKSINTIKQNILDNPKTPEARLDMVFTARELRASGMSWEEVIKAVKWPISRDALLTRVKNIDTHKTELDYLAHSLGIGTKFIYNSEVYQVSKLGESKPLPSDYVMCCVDKDLLNSVQGEHYNYYKNDKYNIKPKWVTTCEKTPDVWFHFQVLMGDSGDGIPGIPGMGPVKAIEAISKDLAVTAKAVRKEKYKPSTDLLKICLDENLFCNLDLTNLWDTVVSTYEANGLTEKDAVRMARLVSMHQLNEKGDLELWTKNLVE